MPQNLKTRQPSVSDRFILQIAIPVPLRKTFDYLPLANQDIHHLQLGIRIKVPFGSSTKIGILVNTCSHTMVPVDKLKSVLSYLDTTPLFGQKHFAWLVWISQYYHHPIGDTLLTALPVLLRKDKTIKPLSHKHWQISQIGKLFSIDELNRAPKQKALLAYFNQQDHAINQSQLDRDFKNWRPALKSLLAKTLVDEINQQPEALASCTQAIPQQITQKMNLEQQNAIDRVCQEINRFGVFLLHGVTGSGKTEVYLNCIAKVIEQKQQALLLIPEIGLTPQLLRRFQSRFGQSVATLHSNMTDHERYRVWLSAKNHEIGILIGTRSAIFTPMAHLGIIIIDEEHDISFKQQEGLRYSARDIAISRAKRIGKPIILGSATPSFESLLNVNHGTYQQLLLTKRAGKSLPPKIQTLGIKGLTLTENFSQPLLLIMKKHLARNEQVMIFLNRRGFAPTMICQECGWVGMCLRCDRPMTIHAKKQRIICHHCGNERKVPSQCPECSSIDLRPRGYGTERTEQVLNQLFPSTEIIRIDRDTTSRKNAMHNLLNRISDQHAQILLGTQMLAKGHDFPNVTLVGILDADQGLFGVDLRASERMAQLITQVAGRAGRGEKAGRVIIQTQHPDHPLLTQLIEHGYGTFSQNALLERKLANLPPYSYSALLRAESNLVQNNIHFLSAVKQFLLQCNISQLEILGPAPSPMERKAGKFHSQLLILSRNRKYLHAGLSKSLNFIESCQPAKKVRWSLDVDPQDMN